MFNRSWKGCLACCAVALYSFVIPSGAAETDPPTDSRGLEEVRHLSTLPPDLAKTIGWKHSDGDPIADYEKESGALIPRSVEEWFLLAGLNAGYALVAVEYRSHYRSPNGIRAAAFSLAGTRWVATGEWLLSGRPHTLNELVQLISSPESQALTTQWRKKQSDDDLQRRIWNSSPNGAHRRLATLREVNISDEEVRQIGAAVADLLPGAIVTISGIVKGCPCEEGPGCSAQVWTAIYRPERTRSLELSDINDHWIVGPVQRWFLESEKLGQTKFPNVAAQATAREALDNRFPPCVAGAGSGQRQ